MKYVIEDLHPQSAISAEAKPSMTQVPGRTVRETWVAGGY